ncbi:hypothetical protein [Microbacterium oleivorans]|nr:hypothetical protein [Microbacterium oleivorans]
MATSNLPTPSLQPISTLTNSTEDKVVVELVDEGASCCGGGCCSTN